MRETANGVTRTTTNTTDEVGRTRTLTVTGGAGEPVPATEYTYSATTGSIDSITSGSQPVSYGYDALGRQVTYDDGTGNAATTTYNALDAP